MQTEVNYMTSGTYLVRCPETEETEYCYSLDRANDVCYSMHSETGSYAYVECWLGHTEIEYGEL